MNPNDLRDALARRSKTHDSSRVVEIVREAMLRADEIIERSNRDSREASHKANLEMLPVFIIGFVLFCALAVALVYWLNLDV